MTKRTVEWLKVMMDHAEPGPFIHSCTLSWPHPLEDDPNKRELTQQDIEHLNTLALNRGVSQERLYDLVDKVAPYVREYGAYVAALIYSDWADGEPPTPKEPA